MIPLISNCFITPRDNASWGPSSNHLYWKLYFPKTASGRQAFWFLCLYRTINHVKLGAAAVHVPSKRQKLWRGFPLWQAIRGCDIILPYFCGIVVNQNRGIVVNQNRWDICYEAIQLYSLISWLCKTLASQHTIVLHTKLWP